MGEIRGCLGVLLRNGMILCAAFVLIVYSSEEYMTYASNAVSK